MNDLQREVKAMQDDLAAGRITIGDARTWCATMAKQIIVKDDPAAALNFTLVALNTTDEKFLEFINGLTDAMLKKEKRNG